MLKTPFAGLTALEPGDSLALDGYSFQYMNPFVIDRVLKLGARSHRHDEHPAIGNPTDIPLVSLTANGNLPNDADIGFGYTLVDADGGESLIAPVAQVTTAPALEPPYVEPQIDTANVGGVLTAGAYVYLLTLTDENGETTAGPNFVVNVPPGTDTNVITISGLSDIVDSIEGATGWRLYKSTNQGKFHFLAAGGASLDDVEDDGLLCADCAVVPPTENTTSVSQGVEVTVPDTPTNNATGVVGFRIYASVGGAFTSPCFVEQRPVADLGVLIDYTHLVVEAGAPPDVNTSFGGAQKIDPDVELLEWHWKRPVATVADLPEPAEPGDVRVTIDTGYFYVWDGTDWLQYTAPVAHWKAPVAEEGALPLVDNVDGDVRLVINTRSLHMWLGAAWQGIVQPPPRIMGPTGILMEQRPTLQFMNSVVTDDPALLRTVVAPEGGGGGGTGPLMDGDRVEWKDSSDNTLGSIRVDRYTTQLVRHGGDFTPDGPLLGWATVHIEALGGAMILKPTAPSGVDIMAGQGPLMAAIAADGTFELVNDSWNIVGMGNIAEDTGVEFVLINADDKAQLRWRVDDALPWAVIQEWDIAGLIDVGDTVAISCGRDNRMLSASAYNVTQDAEIVPYTEEIEEPEGLFGYQRYVGVHFNVADDESVKLLEAYLYMVNPASRMTVENNGLEKVVWDSRNPDQFVALGEMAADWGGGISYRQTLDGAYEFTGQPNKYDGAAPLADELLCTIDSNITIPFDYTVSVVTGDADGVELGMVRIDGYTGQVRWLSGRSSDPVLKNPYVLLNGTRIFA